MAQSNTPPPLGGFEILCFQWLKGAIPPFPQNFIMPALGATEISPEENYLNSTRETRRGTNLYTSSFFPENLKRRLFIFARSLLWMALFSN